MSVKTMLAISLVRVARGMNLNLEMTVTPQMWDGCVKVFLI